MASTVASHTPTIKDKPSAVRHFLDRSTSHRNAPIHLHRSISSGTGSSSSSSPPSTMSTKISNIQSPTPTEVISMVSTNGDNFGTSNGTGQRGNKSGLNRSSSMRGPRAPAVELNAASLSHVRRLLRQLLQELHLPGPATVEQWERALLPILLQATDDLDPDIRAGDEIDVRNFVKIKRIPGATPDDTVYLSGVVFTKNLALKSMPREINSPKVVLLAFPLEYRKDEETNEKRRTALVPTATTAVTAAGSDDTEDNLATVNGPSNLKVKPFSIDTEPVHFMSLEPVMAKEKDELQELVDGIAALQPQVLLTERGISGYALQLLQKKNIAVAYNVNPNVIRAVARSTQADIVTSAKVFKKDKDDGKDTVLPPRVGTCKHFSVKAYVLDDMRTKTFIFMSGCPAQLASTIVLRGGDMEALRQIKIITKFMMYVVYNLKLETCLMRDEFVFMPAPATSMYYSHRSKKRLLTQGSGPVTDEGDKDEEDGVDGSGYYDSLVQLHSSRIVSTSPFVQIPQPYLLWKARKIERRLQALLKDSEEFEKREAGEILEESETETEAENEKVAAEDSESPTPESGISQLVEKCASDESAISSAEQVALEFIKLDMYTHLPGRGKNIVRQVRRAILDQEHDKLEYASLIQKRQWEAYLSQATRYLFDPFAYQHITILYSLVCEVTTAPCTGPELVSIEYYRDGDCTLGQFIEGICDTVGQRCSDGCSYTLAQHYRSYVHGNGRITVRVAPLPCRIPGMENTILMWSHCNVCGTTLPALPMSENTWKYSFGKYLELSFWSSPLSLRADICPHDIHKDHVRVFGLRGLAVKFEYLPIELLEIVSPRTRLLWKPQIDIRLRAEEYAAIEERINKFFDSVITRLDSVRVDDFPSPDRTEDCKARVEVLRDRATREREDIHNMLQTVYVNSSYRAYLPLNAVVRSLQERVVQWDLEFADFDRSFYPSEKDIARLTAMQLRKMFLERDTSAAPFVTEDSNADLAAAADLSSAVELMPVLSERDETSIDSTPLPSSGMAPSDYLCSPEYGPSGFPSPGLSSTITKSGAIEAKRPSISESLSKEELSSNMAGAESAQQLETSSTESTSKSEIVHGAVQAPDSSTTESTHKPQTVEASTTDNETGSTASSSANQSEEVKITLTRIPTENSDVSVMAPLVAKSSNMSTAGTQTSTSSVTTAGADSSATVAAVPARASAMRRKFHPDRIVLPPPFKHRFTQGTTRELALQLQLSRSGGADTHAPSISSSGLGQSKVISLARHFDQLSREFEKERARERKKLAAGRSRAVGTSKPKVEVYRTIEDAVVEEDDDESGLEDGAQSEDDMLSESGVIGRRGKHRRSRRSIDARKQDPLSSGKYKRTSTEPQQGDAMTSAAGGSEVRASQMQGDSLHPSHDFGGESNSPSLKSPSGTIKSPTAPSYFALEHESSRESDGETNHAAASQEPRVPQSVERPQTEEHQEQSVQEEDLSQQASPHEVQPKEHLELSTQEQQNLPPPTPSADHAFHQELHPGPEKISLMTMLSKFWADRSASGWKTLDYPLQPSEHIFMDSDVIVREDEPSSLIAFCLSSSDYLEKLHQIRKSDAQAYDEMSSSDDEVRPEVTSQPNKQFYTRHRPEGETASPGSPPPDSHFKTSREDLRRWLLKETGTHLKYQFQEGSAKLSCKIFYAELFDAFRTLCGCEESYIQSLSRCVKWDSTGGKSGSAFLKTLDDRLVVKQLSPSELDAFINFAPSYFQYMAQVFFHDLPSVIAKIMGFYQVQVRNPITNKSMKMDVIVMENLFYDRKLSRIFDLKGSMRNRHVEQTGKANEVLLDENMVEYIFESPLFVREYSKKILRASLWNDTLFLAKMNVMDYSLVIAIDHERHQLVVGIIDCLRTFTWDKKLESWVKERGLVGGGGKVPTVVTPRQYKNRFREAMERYILMVPDFWHQS
ncbi:hypothetical protein V1525DRAFT_447599 [Lipomyces kononenkoae]|uniref:Uncharacterized protein n=1 Tax=Lipomyces kononenkoae TaxID=34357 RepID=A0ACC3TAU1_LIPKO